MFILKILDRNGREMKPGDIVKISNGDRFCFWAEVTYLEKEKAIAPWHTFSFHSMEYVKEVPKKSVKSTEERYNIWYVYHDDAEEDHKAADYEKYLQDWKDCERQIEKGAYQIELIKTKLF